MTGDRSLALTILLARTAESRAAVVPYSRVLAAERAVIASRFGGSAGAYRAALGAAKASVAVARAALADELRRLALERTMSARSPASSEVSTFYLSYPDLLTARRPGEARAVVARVQDVRPRHRLGRARGGLHAPRRVAASRLRALDGTYTVTASGEAQPLGSVPLAQARPAIAEALRAFARRAAFEAWSTARQETLMKTIVCTRDELPSPGAVRLAGFLPFLSLTAGVSGAAAR